MRRRPKDTLINQLFPWKPVLLAVLTIVPGIHTAQAALAPGSEEDEFNNIQIIEGEDRTIYEYRQNGVLTMIKVVPEDGRPYYMVPADSSAHYEDLDHKRSLYPQWVILEW